MPRPLHATNIRIPNKIQNTFDFPVGADLCVGPLHTCRFRARAHTQVCPYKVGRGSLIDHTSEPGGPPPTGGLITQEQTPEYPPREAVRQRPLAAREAARLRPRAARRTAFPATSTLAKLNLLHI